MDMPSQMNYPLPEQLRRLKSNVRSLQRLLVSCVSSASSAENSVSFYPQPSLRVEGQPGRLEHNEGTKIIFAFHIFHGERSPVASHKCVNASKTKGVRNE